MAISARRLIVGPEPWAIFNVVDFVLIGLMSILAFQILQVGGMAIHRFTLFRVTGSARSPMPMPGAAPLATAQPQKGA